MPKPESTQNTAHKTVSECAELLGVTDRQVRNWIKSNNLPTVSDPRGRLLDWRATLRWYVTDQIARNRGNAGNGGPNSGQSGAEDEPLETMEAALARKTRAEADLKELQLARERGQVAAIADVKRVITASNKAIQTIMLALPSSLATQLIGVDDRGRIHALIERGVQNALANAASIDAILEANRAQPEEEEE